jgi:hypothetical protein
LFEWAASLTCVIKTDPLPVTQQTAEQNSFLNTISYAPLLAYCNMFSIYYLEVISNTKLLTKKNEADSLMGKLVNYIVCLFYVFLFALVWLV